MSARKTELGQAYGPDAKCAATERHCGHPDRRDLGQAGPFWEMPGNRRKSISAMCSCSSVSRRLPFTRDTAASACASCTCVNRVFTARISPVLAAHTSRTFFSHNAAQRLVKRFRIPCPSQVADELERDVFATVLAHLHATNAEAAVLHILPHAGPAVSNTCQTRWHVLEGCKAVLPLSNLVLRKGLEPLRLTAHAPQTCVSTNSTT